MEESDSKSQKNFLTSKDHWLKDSLCSQASKLSYFLGPPEFLFLQNTYSFDGYGILSEKSVTVENESKNIAFKSNYLSFSHSSSLSP